MFKYIEVGKQNDSNTPVGILFHGLGSSAENISSLCNEFLDIIPYWLVIQAPVSMEDVLGYPGYGWVPIENDIIDAPELNWHNLEEYDTSHMNETVAKLDTFLCDLGVFSSPVFLLGFSQGGIVVSELIQQRACRIIQNDEDSRNSYTAAVLFSSALIARTRWQDCMWRLSEEKNKSIKNIIPPILVTHGKQDEVLVYNQGKTLYDFWNQHSPYTDFYGFDGEHEISEEVCSYVHKFLQRYIN